MKEPNYPQRSSLKRDELELLQKIKAIIDKGNDAEVRKKRDEIVVYEIRKSRV